MYQKKKAKIRYGKGNAGVLYCSKNKSKVQLKFSTIENAEIRYCCGFMLISFYENAKIRSVWGLMLMKILK